MADGRVCGWTPTGSASDGDVSLHYCFVLMQILRSNQLTFLRMCIYIWQYAASDDVVAVESG